jgi:hypothetical protein
MFSRPPASSRRRFLHLGTALGVGLVASAATAQQKAADKSLNELNAEEVLRLVRYSYTLFDRDFVGRLRKDKIEVPFTLSLQPQYIRFKFDEPPQIIHLNTSNNQFFLKEVAAGKDGPVDPKRYGEPIRGTDVTYDDLSMRFLYWPAAKIIAEEKKKTRDCWVVEVRNPDGHGQYGTVRVWVDKSSGGMLSMVGYNNQGQAIRVFEVLHGKKIEDIWMVDQMRVETFDPVTRKRLSHTYIEILDVAPTVRVPKAPGAKK